MLCCRGSGMCVTVTGRVNIGGGDVAGCDHGRDPDPDPDPELGCDRKNVVRRGMSLGCDSEVVVMRCADGDAHVHGGVLSLGRRGG